MLSSRCLSNSHLSFANLCSMSPDISHSSCSCSSFVFQCAKVDFLFCFVFVFFSLPNCCFFSWRSNCPSSNWMLLQVGWLLCILLDYENPAVELKELKSLFRKENHNFLLPARKAVGLHLQVTCQGFKKEKMDFILFFSGFKMVKAGIKKWWFSKRGFVCPRQQIGANLILFFFLGQLLSSWMY